MKYLLAILLVVLIASCTTSRIGGSYQTFVLDASKSEGNIVAWQWWINGFYYDNKVSTTVSIKQATSIQLIVIDETGRKDTAQRIIP